MHSTNTRTSPRRRRAGGTASFAVLAMLTVLASGCGGSPRPKVAQVGSTPTSTSPSSSSRGSGDPVAYAECMRRNGVPNFPDPDSHGNTPSFDIGVPDQTWTAARHACQHLRPSGVTAGPGAQQNQKLTLAWKIARCMRAHGFSKFPDPRPPSHGSDQIGGGTGGYDLNSPRFQAAQKTCVKEASQALGQP
jgi:hypothetical protein